MVERLIISGAFVVILYILIKAGILLHNQWILQKIQNRIQPKKETEHPTLIYFWANQCSQCKPQERYLTTAREILSRQGKRIDIKKVNALEERAIAARYHVLTLPTTILLDRRGDVIALNIGTTDARTLVEQFHHHGYKEQS